MAQRVVGGRRPLKEILFTVPTSYVAGNRFTVTHGLTDFVGNPYEPDVAIVQPLAADADGALTVYHAAVVAVDELAVTLRTDAPENTPFALYVG